MSLELPQDDPWVSRGYGQGAIEVTSPDEVIAYLERVRAEVTV